MNKVGGKRRASSGRFSPNNGTSKDAADKLVRGIKRKILKR